MKTLHSLNDRTHQISLRSVVLLIICLLLIQPFTYAQSSWNQLGADLAGTSGDGIGATVSLSSDGQTMATGSGFGPNATNKGLVRVYTKAGSSWMQKGGDLLGEADGDSFGSSISLSDDGNSIAIGAFVKDLTGSFAPNGRVQVYEWSGSSWVQKGSNLDGVDDFENFGEAISLSGNGNRLAIGIPGQDTNGATAGGETGAVRVYEFTTDWNLLGTEIAGNEDFSVFGSAVSLDETGTTLAVGNPTFTGGGFTYNGQVHVYRWSGSAWEAKGSTLSTFEGDSEERLGASVSLSSDGNRLAIGAPYDLFLGSGPTYIGHVQVWDYTAETWTQVGNDIVSNYDGDEFGAKIQLSGDGTHIVIGATGNFDTNNPNGRAQIWNLDNLAWGQVGDDLTGEASDDAAGTSVAISSDGSIVAMGAPSNSGGGASAGQVRLFEFGVADTSSPTVVVATANTPTNSSPVTVSITFNEPVTAFTIDGITINTGTKSNFNGSGKDYTVDITPDADGEVTVLVAAGQAQDAAGNFNEVSNTLAFTYDTAEPTVDILDAPSVINGDLFTVTFEFSEDVTDFIETDVTLTNANISNFQMVDADTYSADITGNGNIKIEVLANTFNDLAGNANASGVEVDIAYDVVGPIVQFELNRSIGPSGAQVLIVFLDPDNSVFEAVNGFELTDIIVENGMPSDLEVISSQFISNAYSFFITPDGEGDVTIDIFAGSVTDAAGNGNVAVTQVIITYDDEAPTAQLSVSNTQINSENPFTLTVTFSEEINAFNFTSDSITASNATISDLAQPDESNKKLFTATVTPASAGDITIEIQDGKAQDLVGNPNPATTPLVITFDNVPPVVTADALYTNDQTPALTGTIDDPAAMISVTLDGQFYDAINNGNGTWTLTDNTIPELSEGTYEISVIATDVLGNQSVEVITQLKIDLTAPEFFFVNGALTGFNLFDKPVNGHPLIINIISEETVGLSLEGINIDGNVVPEFIALTYVQDQGTGDWYHLLALTLADPEVSQVITVTIMEGAATDLAGNASVESVQVITYDLSGPVITAFERNIEARNTSPIPATITFNKSTFGFTNEDLIVGNGTVENISTTDNLNFTFDILSEAEGLVTIQLAELSVEDEIGNLNAMASEVFSFIFDTTAPLINTSTTGTTNLATVPITFTFSEPVNGLSLDDLVVSNGTAANLNTADFVTYTVDISTSQEGLNTISLADGAMTDLAGNPNIASTISSVFYDITPPAVLFYVTNLDEFGNIIFTESIAYVNSNNTFRAGVIFNEQVEGFSLDGVEVQGGSKSNVLSYGINQTNGNDQYSIDVTPDGTGNNISILVLAGAVTDIAGNASESGEYTVQYDDAPPTASLDASNLQINSTDPLTLTVTFSEEIIASKFTADSITVANATLSDFLQPDGADAKVFTATVTPDGSGDVSIEILAGKAVDIAGNPNTATTPLVITFDNVPPVVTADTLYTNDQTPALTGTIDDHAAMISVTLDGQTYDATNNGDGTWTLNILTELAERAYEIFVIATDALGNQSEEVTSLLKIDLTPPQPFFFNDALTGFNLFDKPLSVQPFLVGIIFDDKSTNFELEDITINGAVGMTGLSYYQPDNYYTLALPLVDDKVDQEITVLIEAGRFTDLAGNPNLEGTVTINFDVSAPVVSAIEAMANVFSTSPIPVEITFNEAIVELTAEDLTITNGEVLDITTANDGITFTVNISPIAEGALTVQLPVGAVEDLAGNSNMEASEVLQVLYDATAPTVEITTASTTTATSPIEATITFSEPIVGLLAEDLTINNGTISSLTKVNDMTYIVAVTPGETTVTAGIAVTIALDAGKVEDLAGNGNTASNTASVTFDNQGPIITLTNDAFQEITSVNANFTAIFFFSEAVTGFAIDDIIVDKGTTSNFRDAGLSPFVAYKVDIALAGSEDVTITIPADATFDALGNGNAETIYTIAVDNVGPTVVTISSALTSPTNVSPIPVTFTFNEQVNATTFTADDLVAGNFSATAPTTEDNLTFITNITPEAAGELTISLKEASVEDLAGNLNTNTGSFTIIYDNVPPTVTIAGPDAVNSTTPFTLTLTFSEAIASLDASNITLTSADLGPITSDGNTYSVSITPRDAGNITATVDGFTDLAGNANAASVEKSILYDATRPTVAITGVPTEPVHCNNPITLTFTFSELVTDFTLDDITVTKGTKTNFTGSGEVYTADITPAEYGEVVVSIEENKASDAAGNGNIAVTTTLSYVKKYSGGCGTQSSPFLIATEADLRAISGNTGDFGAHFLQTADIEMSDQQFLPIGSTDQAFGGTYNGQGFNINKLKNISNGSRHLALFGAVRAASLTNISLTSLEIIVPPVVSVGGGGLVGSVLGESTLIQNCFVTGLCQTSGDSHIGYIGGIIGVDFAFNTKIIECFTDITIQGSTRVISGLVGGTAANLEVNDSYSVSRLQSSSTQYESVVGGIIGTMNTLIKISNSYFAGSIQAEGFIPNWGFKEGLIGYESTRNLDLVNSSVINSFFDREISAIETSGGGGTGLTTAQMYNRQTYVDAGWDLNNTWTFVPNSYPRLKWQAERHNKPFTVSGKVVDENGNPFTAGTVSAFSFGNTSASKTITPDASGNFTFDLEAETYFLSVFPNDFSKYHRTYLGNTNRLDRSKVVFYDNIGYVIQMIPNSTQTKLDGNGRVSGSVVRSANGGRIVQGRILEGDPLEGVTVMLIRISDEEVMTSVETDAEGKFEITGIPAGEYQLVLGVAGIDLNLEGSTFTMDEEGTPLTISAAVSEDGVSFAIEEILGVEDEIAFAFYPNPATDLVKIELSGAATIRVVDLTGKTVLERSFTDRTELDILALKANIYFLEITNEKGRAVRKLIKSK